MIGLCLTQSVIHTSPDLSCCWLQPSGEVLRFLCLVVVHHNLLPPTLYIVRIFHTLKKKTRFFKVVTLDKNAFSKHHVYGHKTKASTEEKWSRNFTFCFYMITDLLQQEVSTGRSYTNQFKILQKTCLHS